ncbi:MAG: leucine-rich repeat domain-containing protein [Ruminococcaceae bacterium]|nr:leucine-rich repeat domain-containing protein [Oscillospiraceae bacterium]
MKRTIFVLLCFSLLFLLLSCAIESNDGKSGLTDTGETTSDLGGETTDNNEETTDNNEDTTDNNEDITEPNEPCAHTLGAWGVVTPATERADGLETRKCMHCDYFETRILHAIGTEGLLFTLSEDKSSYSVSAGTATEGDVYIPAYHNGLPVTSIAYIGFADSDFEPENMERGSYAFFQCTELKSVVIPETVNVIGDGAFMLCEALERIVIPESVKEIGEYAFALTAEDVISKYFDDIRVAVPQSEVLLILREWQAWVASGVEIYYLDESGNEVLIADTYFDNDAYCPFSDGKFEIINNNDGTFSVRAGESSDKAEWIERTFDLPECVSVVVPKQEDGILIFYGGETDEMWKAIDVAGTENKRLENAVIHYHSETAPNEPYKAWHYVDGVPTIW